MSDDAKDRILEAFLEEMLGDLQPPDLSEEVRRSLADSADSQQSKRYPSKPHLSDLQSSGSHDDPRINGNGTAPGFDGVVDPPPLQTDSHAIRPGRFVVPRRSRRTRHKVPRWLMTGMVAVSILFAGVVMGLFALKISNRPTPETAQAEAEVPAVVADEQPVRADEVELESDEPAEMAGPAEWEPRFPDTSLDLADDPAETRARRSDLPDPSAEAEVIAFIDANINEKLLSHGIVASGPTTAEQWCRRAYDRILGRQPNKNELARFVNGGDERKQKLIDRLLASPDYDRHWSQIWTRTLLGPNLARGKYGEELRRYFADAMSQNKPYDEVVYELMTASGSAGLESGAAAFLLAGIKDDARLATRHASSVFMGQGLQCAECHDPQVAGLNRLHYWELNSFFRQVKGEKSEGQSVLIDRDWPADQLDVYYETPEGVMVAASPVLPDGTLIERSQRTPGISPRKELAAWIVNSDKFSRAVVNRLWAHFFRYGFTEQVDQMGADQPISHPELLSRLSNEFMAHGYDLKELSRWMVMSDTFGQSTENPSGEMVDLPQFGQPPLFSYYYQREPQSRGFAQALATTRAALTRIDSRQFASRKFDWLNQAAKPPTDEISVDDTTNQSTSFAGQMGIGSQRQELLKRLAQSKLSVKQQISHVFWSVISRSPNSAELEVATKLYNERGGNGEAALEVICLSLLNWNP